jgi:hypothetical protein
VTDDTRALIRHLYFVAQVPLRAIAEHLGLSERAVRGALVLAGGQPPRRDPAPLATALAANAATAPPPSAPISSPGMRHGVVVGRRPTQRHR